MAWASYLLFSIVAYRFSYLFRIPLDNGEHCPRSSFDPQSYREGSISDYCLLLYMNNNTNQKIYIVISSICIIIFSCICLTSYFESWTLINSFKEAVEKNDVEKAKTMLVKHKNLVHLKEKYSTATPLFYARSITMAKLLILYGADINAKLDNGITLLHEMACSDSGNELLNFYIAKGLYVDAKDFCDGKTPLHSAAERDCLKNIDTLISKSADVNSKDFKGITPLHIAVNSDRANAAELLISRGADINAKNFEGETPLHSAVKNNHIRISKILILKGASIDEKDNYGHTPYIYAIAKGYKDIADLLRKHGAKE